MSRISHTMFGTPTEVNVFRLSKQPHPHRLCASSHISLTIWFPPECVLSDRVFCVCTSILSNGHGAAGWRAEPALACMRSCCSFAGLSILHFQFCAFKIFPRFSRKNQISHTHGNFVSVMAGRVACSYVVFWGSLVIRRYQSLIVNDTCPWNAHVVLHHVLGKRGRNVLTSSFWMSIEERSRGDEWHFCQNDNVKVLFKSWGWAPSSHVLTMVSSLGGYIIIELRVKLWL